MRKEWIICIVVVIVVVIVNIITQNYTKKSIEFMNEKLEAFKVNLLKEEKEQEKIEEEMKDIMKEWKKKYEKMAYYIEHDELEKVETELTSLNAHIDIEEYEDGMPELEKSIFILNHIKDKFKFDIKNIF